MKRTKWWRRMRQGALGVMLLGVLASGAWADVGEAPYDIEGQLGFWAQWNASGDWAPVDRIWGYTLRGDLRLPGLPARDLWGVVVGFSSASGKAEGTIRHRETGETHSGHIRFGGAAFSLGIKVNSPVGPYSPGYVYAMGGGVIKSAMWFEREAEDIEALGWAFPDEGWSAWGRGPWGEIGAVLFLGGTWELGVSVYADWVHVDLAGARRRVGGVTPMVFLGWHN